MFPVCKGIIAMLLPSPEHNATAIRGVPLVLGSVNFPGLDLCCLASVSKAVIQACNWCYAVLAKDFSLRLAEIL